MREAVRYYAEPENLCELYGAESVGAYGAYGERPERATKWKIASESLRAEGGREMNESFTVREVFGEVARRATDEKKPSPRRGSKVVRGFKAKELEQIGARALRLADMGTRRRRGGPDGRRVEALTELGHAALRVMSLQELAKAREEGSCPEED